MALYKTYSKADFDEWATKVFTDYRWTTPKRGNEFVLASQSTNGLEFQIYTSVDVETNKTRDVGEDAIRIVVWDVFSGKPFSAFPRGSRINRVEDATTIFDRMNDRLSEINEKIQNALFCQKCEKPKHMALRTNRKTKQQFYSCSGFPDPCGKLDVFKIRDRYPLADLNPLLNELEIPEQVPSGAKVPERLVPASEESGGRELLDTNIDVDPRFLLDIVDEDKVTPCSEYPYHKFPYESFNRVQSVVLQHDLIHKECNMVVGTATSTGKTVVGELFMGPTLKQGKKVVYCSPLKSLTEEKREDWENSWVKEHDYKLCIMTGDYVMSEKRSKEINNANLICVTSEMLDSRTRNHASEKSSWIHDVGLLILDESHIISTDRGHAVEAGLLRFTQLNPKARIVFLSATMPNVNDFQRWLCTLNNKDTYVINSAWRPTQLQWHLIPHAIGDYYTQEHSKANIALELVEEKPDEKYLVFVHSKTVGRTLESLFNKEGVDCKFHNADLALKNRLEIEKSFASRENGLRVLISTSTLAWGRSLPARNVVIVGTKRGLNDVDELDIIQMGGRAGRKGIDPCGDVFFIMENETKWEQILSSPRKVISKLLSPEVLGFHILAEIKNSVIFNEESMNEWFNNTLAKLQLPIKKDLVDSTLSRLIKQSMMEIDDRGHYKLKALGRISSTLYFMPSDVFHWSCALGAIERDSCWNSDLALSWLIGGAPSMQLNYVPRNDVGAVEEYVQGVQEVMPSSAKNIRQSVVACYTHKLLSGNGSSVYVKGIQKDIERFIQAFTWMNGMYKLEQDHLFNTLALRVQFGVGEELVELCKLPRIGGARAKKLFNFNVRSIADVINKPKQVQSVMGEKAMPEILAAARVLQRQASGIE